MFRTASHCSRPGRIRRGRHDRRAALPALVIGFAAVIALAGAPAVAQDGINNPFSPTIDRGDDQYHSLVNRIIPDLERQINGLNRQIERLQREVSETRRRTDDLEQRPVSQAAAPPSATPGGPPALPGAQPPPPADDGPGLMDLATLADRVGLNQGGASETLESLTGDSAGGGVPALDQEYINASTFVGCVNGLVMLRDEKGWAFFINPEEASSHAVVSRLGPCAN